MWLSNTHLVKLKLRENDNNSPILLNIGLYVIEQL
jgi:hypothetical protein